MFEEVFGLPLHPLLIHAVVVFVPLQILAGLAYSFVPFIRRFIAWAVVILAVVAPLSALFAKLSGDAFQARLIRNGTAGPPLLDQIAQHSGYGNNTVYFASGLGVLMLLLVAVQVMRSRQAVATGRAAAPDGDGAEVTSASGKGPIVLAAVLTVAVLGIAAVTGYYVFKTGDTGAHMVWTGM